MGNAHTHGSAFLKDSKVSHGPRHGRRKNAPDVRAPPKKECNVVTTDQIAGKEQPDTFDPVLPREESRKSVQHITDRLDQVNFTTSTDDLLMSVNQKCRVHTSKRRRKSMHPNSSEVPLDTNSEMTPFRSRIQRYDRTNSCGTLFVDATVANQNLDQTIQRFGSMLWELVANGHMVAEPVLEEIFDETIHPISRSSAHVDSRVVPSERDIQKFLKLIFRSVQLCAEVAIIALIYVHRLIGMAGITLHTTNWRRLVLSSIALASKVWDDQAVWNVDYCSVLPMIQIQNMNELEKKFLLFIQFNVSVEPSLYAKYYFDLRKLAIAEDFNAQPLDTMTAKKLKISGCVQIAEDVEDIKTSSRSKSAEWLNAKPTRAFL